METTTQYANRKGFNPFTKEERSEIANNVRIAGIVIDGIRTTQIGGIKNDFATVWINGLSAEFAWQTIARGLTGSELHV